MKDSKSPPSYRSRNSSGDFCSMETYFQQLTLIDIEYFYNLLPVESDFDDAIVQEIITDVFKLEKSGFQCIKRVKRSPRTSLPLQSDWIKLIEKKENQESTIEGKCNDHEIQSHEQEKLSSTQESVQELHVT